MKTLLKLCIIAALPLLIVAYVAFCLYMLVEHPVATIIVISVAVFALYQLVIRSKVVDNEYPELVEKYEKLERRRRMREILKPMGRKSTAYPDGKVVKYELITEKETKKDQ